MSERTAGVSRFPTAPPLPPQQVTDDPKYTNMAISQTDYGALDIGRSFNLGVRTPSDPGCDQAGLRGFGPAPWGQALQGPPIPLEVKPSLAATGPSCPSASSA